MSHVETAYRVWTITEHHFRDVFICSFIMNLNLYVQNIFLLQKWHPDKHNDASAATLKFQEINEAYRG